MKTKTELQEEEHNKESLPCRLTSGSVWHVRSQKYRESHLPNLRLASEDMFNQQRVPEEKQKCQRQLEDTIASFDDSK